MIFVDTGAWFGAIIASDVNHAAAAAWLASNKEPLFTTDYVVSETLTLLRRRGEAAHAIHFGQQIFGGKVAALYYLTEADIAAAWQVFKSFRDKDWSFTDCTSKVVMERLGITEAFSFDQHFRQFGTVTVVP